MYNVNKHELYNSAVGNQTVNLSEIIKYGCFIDPINDVYIH